MVQLESKGRKRPTPAQAGRQAGVHPYSQESQQPLVPARASADWMGPTHIREGNAFSLAYSLKC